MPPGSVARGRLGSLRRLGGLGALLFGAPVAQAASLRRAIRAPSQASRAMHDSKLSGRTATEITSRLAPSAARSGRNASSHTAAQISVAESISGVASVPASRSGGLATRHAVSASAAAGRTSCHNPHSKSAVSAPNAMAETKNAARTLLQVAVRFGRG